MMIYLFEMKKAVPRVRRGIKPIAFSHVPCGSRCVIWRAPQVALQQDLKSWDTERYGVRFSSPP